MLMVLAVAGWRLQTFLAPGHKMSDSSFLTLPSAARRWFVWLAMVACGPVATGCAVNPVPTPGKALDTKGNDATASGVGTDQADAGFAEGDTASLASDATESAADASALDGSCVGAGQDGAVDVDGAGAGGCSD